MLSASKVVAQTYENWNIRYVVLGNRPFEIAAIRILRVVSMPTNRMRALRYQLHLRWLPSNLNARAEHGYSNALHPVFQRGIVEI
jgi:hypothetical protein